MAAQLLKSAGVCFLMLAIGVTFSHTGPGSRRTGTGRGHVQTHDRPLQHALHRLST